MDLSRRLSKAVMIYELSRAVYDKPDFSTFSERELIQYLVGSIETRHRDNNIKTLERAVKYWEMIPERAVSQEEKEIMIETERNYFSDEYQEMLNELE